MNNEEAVRRIETKLRLGKLDSLLLFLSSLLGLGFALLQLMYNNILILVYFLPLLFLILVMPVYIGYIRGAILLDSIVERIRGWLFLMLGGGFYIGTVIFISLLKYFDFELELWVGLISSGVVVIATIYSNFTAKVFFRVFGYKMSKEINETIIHTLESAFCLGLSFIGLTFLPSEIPKFTERFITEELLIIKIFDIISLIFIIAITFLLILNSIFAERKARYWSKKVEEAQKTKE